MREAIGTGKTIELAIEAACAQLGVERDAENVSTEILEMPVNKLFRHIPAKVKVTVQEPEAPAEPPKPAEPKATKAPREEKPAKAEKPAAPKAAPAADAEPEVEIKIEENEKVQAAVAYLTEVFAAMGVEGVTFTAVQKGEATILKVSGEHLSALIGRRGETMEALSYLASLVANRLGGDYMKLGLDVAGYRNKREADLEALAKRLCEKVIRTGRRYAVEPMNPYERRIIHSAVGKIEGVRSESDGEGPQRHVVIYSTDPNASNELDRSCLRGRGGSRGGQRRSANGNRSERRGSGRGPRPNGRSGRPGRGGERRGPRPSSVPGRSFSEVSPDQATPVAPKRAERINDADGFALYGKIEL